jgi:hypothetical protein
VTASRRAAFPRSPFMTRLRPRPPSCNVAAHLVWELQHKLIRSFLYIART